MADVASAQRRGLASILAPYWAELALAFTLESDPRVHDIHSLLTVFAVRPGSGLFLCYQRNHYLCSLSFFFRLPLFFLFFFHLQDSEMGMVSLAIVLREHKMTAVLKRRYGFSSGVIAQSREGW